MTRLMRWLARDAHEEPQPHFHSGPQSLPSPCYDPRCPLPRLDVRTALSPLDFTA